FSEKKRAGRPARANDTRTAAGKQSSMLRPTESPNTASLQSLRICHQDGGPMLHEQWKEQNFAAGASNNHHRTEGGRRTELTLAS
ncbi:hypothetical protein KUV57_24865, partial [Epibacterium sp. DP7N7-1]|nr:hypothetical protein [Epibacterium sp. DP7N7-1]